MEVALINGSPKGKTSNSECIINDIKQCLEGNKDSIIIHEYIWNRHQFLQKDFEEICHSDAMVFVFPLYIDSIPSHLLRILVDFEDYVVNLRKSGNAGQIKDVNVFAVVNNGFFEGKQNHIAIANIKHWCSHIGFNMCQGIGTGGGGMLPSIQKVPLGHGPKKKIGAAIEEMASNIISGKSGKSQYMEPDFPALVYKFIVERQWRSNAKANGTKLK